MAKNLCGKTRKPDAPYARWFCFVTSPACPDGEYGDTYVAEIKRSAVKVG